MGRLIILVAIALLLIVGSKWLRDGYRERGRAFVVKSLLVGVAVVFVLLAATGRAHWLGALLASLLAALRFLLPVLVRSLPILERLIAAKASAAEADQRAAAPGPQMNVEEALEVLGLQPNPSREEIIEAHRRLIQKLHPDRGGNDFLAAQINRAKDVLLDHYFP